MNVVGNSNTQINTYISAVTNQGSATTNSTPSRILNQYPLVIFLDPENSWLPFFGEKSSIYRREYMDIHCNVDTARAHLATNSLNILNVGSTGEELIEKGIILVLMNNFHLHWLWNGTDASIGENGLSRDKRNLEERFGRGEKLDIPRIKSIFNKNVLINTDGVLVHDCLFIPPGSTLLTGPETITISNQFCTLSVSYQSASSGVPSDGLFGVNTLSNGETLQLFRCNYVLAILYEENTKSNTTSDLEPYRHWRETIIGSLSKWDFNNVKKETDKEMQRRATEKSLGLKPYDPYGILQRPFNRTGDIGASIWVRTVEVKVGKPFPIDLSPPK